VSTFVASVLGLRSALQVGHGRARGELMRAFPADYCVITCPSIGRVRVPGTVQRLFQKDELIQRTDRFQFGAWLIGVANRDRADGMTEGIR